jgi:protein TonB
VVEADDNQIYNTAGIEIKPVSWGMDKFYSYVGKIIVLQKKKGLRKSVRYFCVVEKDGSLTDIKVRDIGLWNRKGKQSEFEQVSRRNPGFKMENQ